MCNIEFSEFKLEASDTRKADMQKLDRKHEDIISQINEVHDALRTHISRDQQAKVLILILKLCLIHHTEKLKRINHYNP